MKRTTIAAIAALALSSAFVACGGSGTTTGAGDTTAHTTTAATRAQGIARYVQQHGLKVTMYQDYGWPAKELSLGAVR